MYISNSELLRESNRAGVRFLLAEVDAGLTLLAAATTTVLPTHRERCLRNAGAVYGVVRKLLPRVQPDPDENQELHDRMDELRSGLIQAGCGLDF